MAPLMNIVAICGSLRARSSNLGMLRAVARLAPEGMNVTIWEGLGGLPHFNPDLDADGDLPPPPVQAFRELLLASDGIVISSPEYAHGVPGSLKNALDWVVSTGELVGIPVLLINAAPVGGDFAQASLVETLSVMNWNVLREASRLAPFVKRKLDAEGKVEDEETVRAIRAALESLAQTVSRARK
jgi:chromate reductase, NAD(P)H dehydrogenase (quinone)